MYKRQALDCLDTRILQQEGEIGSVVPSLCHCFVVVAAVATTTVCCYDAGTLSIVVVVVVVGGVA